MRKTTLLCMVPPCWGCGWQTSAASRGGASSGSSSSASSRPAGPSRNSDSMRRGILVGAVIRELNVDSEIVALDQRDDLLERISILAADPHEIALNRCLDLLLAVL